MLGGGESHITSVDFQEEMIKRGNTDATLLFPVLATGSTTKIPSFLKECVGKIEGLPNEEKLNVTARSLRYGSLQECAINSTCGREATVFCEGWENNIYSNNHSIDYMTGLKS